jgi:hypothetical protein
MKKIFTLALLAVFALVSCTPNSNDPVVPQPEACDKHDVDLITTEVCGMYYHNEYSESENSYNYGIVLCNHTGVYDLYTGGVDVKPNETYVFLDLFSDVVAPNKSASFKVPNGTYTVDPENTTNVGTVGAEYSSIAILDAEGLVETEVLLAGGTVTVTDHIIDAMLLDEEGKVYHIQGVNKVVDNSNTYGVMQLDYPTTTLESDLALSWTPEASFVYADNYGDYFFVNKNMWYIEALDEAAGTDLALMLLVDPAKESPAGTYEIGGNVNNEVALFGYMDPYYGAAVGCWAILYDENTELAGMAALKAGKVTVAINGENATITIDANDGEGHKVTGTCTAPYVSSTGWSLKKLSNASKFATAKNNLAPRKVKPSMVVKR